MWKILDNTNLEKFLESIKKVFGTKVDKEDGKGLSTNDFTDEYKSAIDNLPESYAPTDAERNTIIAILKNGVELTIDENRKVDIDVPTKVSDIENDSNFITKLVSDLVNYYLGVI